LSGETSHPIKAQVFARNATGLVRSWSAWTSFIYSFLITSVIGNGALLFASFLGFGFFSGADLPLSILITGLASIPMIFVYASMGSAIPRAGGDYVWMSRILGPGASFVLVTVANTVFLAGWVAAQGEIGSIFILPSALSIMGFGSAVSFLFTSSGQILVTFLLIVIPFALISTGMRTVGAFLKVAFATSIAGSIMIISLLSLAHNTFQSNYATAIGSNAYQNVISTATGAGFRSASFSLWSTIVCLTFFTGMLGPVNNIAPHLGEVRGASSLKKLFTLQFAAIALGTALTGTIFYLISYGFGSTFWGSLSYLFLIGKPTSSAPPFAPYFIFMSTYAAGKLRADVAVFLLIFVLIGQLYANLLNALQPVKYLFAQSFDRLLPERISYVNARTRSPLAALLVILVGSIIWAVAGVINPNYTVFKLISANVLGYVVFIMGACLAGALFPYRLKTIFHSSESSRYRVGGLPLVTLAGAIGLVYLATMIYIWATVPQLGVFATPALTTVGEVYGLIIILYVILRVAQSYRKVPLSLTFKEIPPE